MEKEVYPEVSAAIVVICVLFNICFRWPQFVELLDSDFTDWFDEYRYIHELKHHTRDLLATMSPRFYKRYELSDSDLIEWAELIQERPRTYNYLVYDLINIVNTHLPIHSVEVVPIT